MFSLVLGELKGIFNLRTLKLVFLALIGVFIINSMFPGIGVIIITPMVVYFIVISYGFYNIKENRYEIFLSSIPISREDIVISKYILGIFSLVIGLVTSFIFFSPMGLDIGYPISIVEIVFGIAIILIMLSILIPLNLKNEYRVCRVLNPIMFFFIIYLGYSAFYNTLISAMNGRLNYYDMINYLNSDRNVIIFFGIVIVSLLMYIVSMKISINIYKNKDI